MKMQMNDFAMTGVIFLSESHTQTSDLTSHKSLKGPDLLGSEGRVCREEC